MGGSGGPNPKAREIDSATVVGITTLESGNKIVGFEVAAEHAAYFEQEGIGTEFRLIAVEK